tara:strand:- start:6633 stop:6836 length:204 start_codon:yes stop_codon:yes gene_type:complete
MSKSIQWSHDEKITAEEFIKRIQPLVCDPVEVMMECDGDMWMSDYSKLVSAFWRLKNATDSMDKKDG